jgi:hypothetical protein
MVAVLRDLVLRELYETTRINILTKEEMRAYKQSVL